MRLSEIETLLDYELGAPSTARGVGVGMLTTLICIPSLAVALLDASLFCSQIAENAPDKFLAFATTANIDTALLATLLAAGATGLLGVDLAAWIAVALVGRGRFSAFVATGGLGTALIATLTWWGARLVFPGDYRTLAASAATAWLMGLAALYLVDMLVAFGPDRERL